MQQQALLHVVAKNLYNQDAQRTPIPYGVLDQRMVKLFNITFVQFNNHLYYREQIKRIQNVKLAEKV